MKEFDLEKALSGHPICTRAGFKARILCSDLGQPNTPIVVAAYTEKDGGKRENVYPVSIKGEVWLNAKTQDDIMLDTVIKEGWVNLYKGHTECGLVCGSEIYPAMEEAQEWGSKEKASTYITTTKITWEE